MDEPSIKGFERKKESYRRRAEKVLIDLLRDLQYLVGLNA